jgi:serine acetyltransferase
MSWVSRGPRDRIREDVDAAIARDPAAASRSDVVLNSPGLHAIWAHRLSTDSGSPREPSRSRG